MLQTADGGFLVTGHTESYGAGMEDVYLIRTDNNGNLLWSKTYGGVYDDEGSFANQTADDGFIVTGLTGSFGAGDRDIYVVRTDSLGDTLWTKTFGGIGYDEGYYIRQNLSGEYNIAGITFSFGTGSVYLIVADSTGTSGCNENATATVYANAGTNTSGAATVLTSGAIVSSTAFVVNSSLTIEDTLCSPTGMNNVIPKDGVLRIYPNPTTGEITLRLVLEAKADVKIRLYNITGAVVFEEMLNDRQGQVSVQLDLSKQANGVYFLQTIAGPETYNHKIVKQY